MREHQIVITLKPDQFLEVQRLARAANAKSMGVFVRQKLLAALGIEGSLGDEQIPATNGNEIDLDVIVADLRRVHGELKAFVAESLSPYSPEAFGQAEHAADANLQEFNDFEQGDEVEDELVSQAVAEVEATHNDELEKVAERTFAISPRLGPIGEQSSTVAETKNLLTRHEMHSRRDVHRYHHPHAANELMDEPFVNEQLQAPPAVPSPPPSTPAVDPLSKLLSSEDMIKKPIPRTELIDDDDEEFNVPLSIAERRRLLAEGESEPAPYREPPHPDLQPTLPSEIGTAEMPLETVAAPENSLDPLPEPDDADENGMGTASQPSPPPQNELGRPLGYPPLSGSPPPKRRQL
jgi:hypothetical protein